MLARMETTSAQTSPRSADRGNASPEREQRRQLALRHVRQYPDPVLRRETHEVTEFDDELRQLVQRMWSIMDDAFGVGLAAPQLGLLLRLFTWRVEEGDEPQVLVNPRITWSSEETDVAEEGCLSLGDMRVDVRRPVAIKVTGQDLDGTELELEPEGFLARVFQHEIDHLDGVLAFERAADDDARRSALAYLRPKP
jgi:peptide deformylase